MEEILDPEITIKVIANQWYWSFEYGNLDLEWDSYMINEADLIKGEPRLLTVDNPLFIPVETHTRLLVTSRDVIHAFAVPSLGLKVDAVPGRSNQLSCYINRTGIFWGQCSELCGVNHGFMPLQIVSIDFPPLVEVDHVINHVDVKVNKGPTPDEFAERMRFLMKIYDIDKPLIDIYYEAEDYFLNNQKAIYSP